MATYYVRTDGSNANTGLGSTTATAWQTITYALANMTLTTGTNYLYIAPGVYRESPTLTVTPSSTQTLVISGDPTATQFTGVTANQVRVTGAASDSVRSSTGTRFTLGNKTYVTVQNLVIEVLTSSFHMGINTTGNNITIEDCVIYGIYTSGSNGAAINCEPNISTLSNMNIRNNIICGFSTALYVTCFGGTSISGINVSNNRFISNLYHIFQQGTPSVIISNNVFIGGSWGVYITAGNTTNLHLIQNNIIGSVETGIRSGNTGWQVQRNNIINSLTDLTNVSSSASTITSDFLGVDFGQALLQGFGSLAPFGTILNSRNTAFGVATSAPVTDAYNVAWTGATPDVGAVTYRSLSSANPYEPTERNASTITIAPGSTSQSIELYLGVVGLTSSTSGLAAYYNRTRTASVSIPLVARTIAQAWTAGGFAEVDATNMPGVYRLDIPDAALAAGADDVTVVVRGASGTNGAVMTVKLSSGGLTEAQTAAAVLDALTDDHQIHGTFGYNLLRADAPSKEGLVTLHQSGGISRVDADVHAIANDTDAATELKGALLHNGTDYISADLLTPVSAATSVHIGPYQLLADGLGADQPLDVNVGTATSIDVQVTDANGTGIDITGATVTAKVYNAGGTLVATYSGTATYADNGRLSFGLTTTVTNTSGTYTVTVTRTTGATDTQVFGPLKLYVRPV
jgi:hypothetical protein